MTSTGTAEDPGKPSKSKRVRWQVGVLGMVAIFTLAGASVVLTALSMAANDMQLLYAAPRHLVCLWVITRL
jgi:hypothetical protein